MEQFTRESILCLSAKILGDSVRPWPDHDSLWSPDQNDKIIVLICQ